MEHEIIEIIEITQGITDWFEVGFYIFSSEKSGQGPQWVGDHIRPRVRIRHKWNWSLEVGLSKEIGYQRRQFSFDAWT